MDLKYICIKQLNQFALKKKCIIVSQVDKKTLKKVKTSFESSCTKESTQQMPQLYMSLSFNSLSC